MSWCVDKQLKHISSSLCISPFSNWILKLSFKSSAPRSFSGDSWEALTSEFLLCSKTDALAEDLLSPAYTLLRSLKAAAVVATAFTPVVVPIPTSAATVIFTEVAAVVAAANPTAAADRFSAIVVAAAGILSPAAAVQAAVAAAADRFSATFVAAAGIFSPAAAVQAAVAAETAVLLEGEEQFLLSIQASLLLLARSLRLLLGGRFFLPCLWELLAGVVAPGRGLQKILYSSPPSLVSKTSLAQIPLATQSLYSCKMWAERGGEYLLAGPGGVLTVVDPEGGLSPFSPSLPRRGEREGRQYAPPQPPLSLHPIWGRRGRKWEGRCGWLEYQGQERHVLPLARKPADCKARKPADRARKPADLARKPADWTRKPADWARKPADWARKIANLTSIPTVIKIKQIHNHGPDSW